MENKKLLYFSTQYFTHNEFKLIGYDCGYIFDNNSFFYPGFSTIANEIIRMDNDFCNLYKKN